MTPMVKNLFPPLLLHAEVKGRGRLQCVAQGHHSGVDARRLEPRSLYSLRHPDAVLPLCDSCSARQEGLSRNAYSAAESACQWTDLSSAVSERGMTQSMLRLAGGMFTISL